LTGSNGSLTPTEGILFSRKWVSVAFKGGCCALSGDNFGCFSSLKGSLKVTAFSCCFGFSFPFSSHATMIDSNPSISAGMYYDKKKSKTQTVNVINTNTGETFGYVRDFRPYFSPMIKTGIPQKLGESKKTLGIPKGRMKHPFHGYVSPGILYPLPLVKLEKEPVNIVFLRAPRFMILSILPNNLVMGFPMATPTKMNK
jgi:hypothetical protein